MKVTFWNWARTFLISLCLAGAASVQAQSCVPGSWGSPPNNLWDAGNGSMPVQAESARFQIRWPSNKVLLTPEQTKAALNEMEAVLNWFTGPQVKWPEPYCDTAVKYKVQVFINDGYGFTGSGAGERAQAMWVNPGALTRLISGETTFFVHEFTHTMQYHSKGMRDTQLGGWLWESHAEFMAHQYPGNLNKIGTSARSAWMPHLYYGSTHLRYANWQFWDFLKNKYGFGVINDLYLKTAGQREQDPLTVLMRNQGWTPALLGDEFGQFAMRNVTWDYVDSQDGFNRGVEYRKAYGPITDLGRNRVEYELMKRVRVARMEAVDPARRRFVVSRYFAPQRYGYNFVKLVPDAGASTVTVKFNGVMQKTIAAGAEVGTGAFEPGASPNWTAYTMPTNPASNWRWGVVAIDQSGNPRYSPMQRGATATMNFALQAGDQGVYLVVAATPDQYHSIFWEQRYHTLYRYPYAIELAGAMPDGFQPGYQANVANAWPAGARHPNGGGWVATGAVVEPTAYVGPNAAVLGGRVLGSARIEDYAMVWSGTVQDKAIVGGLTLLAPNITVAENARIRSVLGEGLRDGAVLKGTTTLYGNLATANDVKLLTQGVFSGFLSVDMSTKAEFGANRNTVPVEVTEPTVLPPVWRTDCALDGQVCVLPAGSVATVWYGAGLNLSARTGMTGLIACNSATFGDPAPGLLKNCSFMVTAATATPPSQAVTCAQDGQTCVLPANNIATVWYGAGTRFITRLGVGARIDCNPATFGDPATGVRKTCSYVVTAAEATPPTQAVRCAQEGQICVLPATTTATVWFGTGTRFILRTGVRGRIACDAATFGNPAFGLGKTCSYTVTATLSAPPAQAVTCAQEGQTCVLPAGTAATVWYGAGTRFYARTDVNGRIACSAASFGDPAIGVSKSCSYLRN